MAVAVRKDEEGRLLDEDAQEAVSVDAAQQRRFVKAKHVLLAAAFVLACMQVEGCSAAKGTKGTGEEMRGDDLLPTNEVTGQGCTCESTTCGPSLIQHHSCDWCKTPKGCGEWAVTSGYHDYCSYKDEDSFASLSAEEKMDVIWNKTIADKTPGPLPNVPQTLAGILTISTIATFDNEREVLPAGRAKVIHSQGALLQVDFEVDENSTYTGLLAGGKHRGLVRLSCGQPKGKANCAPGLAIKFLRSGIHSANSMLLHLDGHTDDPENLQFFQKSFCNHAVPPQFLMLKAMKKFSQASGCQAMTGLSDMCAYTQDGKREGALSFPYELIFEPPDPLHTSLRGFQIDYSAADPHAEAHRALTSIPKGFHLFNILAKESPSAPAELLGKMVTASETVTSHFGDTALFFRHQRMEEDFAFHPEWMEPASKVPTCDSFMDDKGSLRPLSDWRCPNVFGIPPPNASLAA